MDFQEIYEDAIDAEWEPERPFGTPTPFLIAVLVHFSAAPTTSEKLVISYASDKGNEFETELFSVDPSTNGLTDIFVSQSSLEIPLQEGETIKVAYPNTDGNKIGVTLKAKYVA